MTEELRRELLARWSAGSGGVREAARYALLTPGKMLRPLLLVASTDAVGGDRRRVVPAALAVEYLHVASLVHDDVIDGDELRRGRLSVHTRYGTAEAIVTGDFLILTMLPALAECGRNGIPTVTVLEAIRVLAEAGMDMCLGQAKEIDLAGDPSCLVSDYEAMIALKTGALFRGACRAGAILGGAGAEHREAITRFAEHLGLAFQMHDDLLPYLVDPEGTGKPPISDARNLRPTLPVVVGYEVAGARDRKRFSDALGGGVSAEEAYGLLREAVESTGALDRGRSRVEQEAALAREQLAALPDSAGADLLAAVLDVAVRRDRQP